jgi:nucleosome assembly protein 1-like 1
MLSDERSKIND